MRTAKRCEDAEEFEAEDEADERPGTPPAVARPVAVEDKGPMCGGRMPI